MILCMPHLPFRDLDLDLRIAWRTLRRRPVYALTVVGTLALGLAAASVVFSLIDHLLLRPVPGVGEPRAAVEIGRSFQGQGFDTLSWPEFEDLAGLDEFAAVAVVRDDRVSVQQRVEAGDPGGPPTHRRPALVVSPAYFEAMGVVPARGRFFTAGEGDPHDPREVVVVSHRFWQRELGSDQGVVGSTLRVNRVPFTVVGVASADFRGHDALSQPDLWLPTGALVHTSELHVGVVPGGEVEAGTETSYRNSNWLHVVARLAPGVSVRQADAAVAGLFASLRHQFPDVYEQKNARVLPLRAAPGGVRSQATWFLGLLLALTGILVAVSCANVSGLFLARTADRRRELAVRLAVGSGRTRLVRQLLVELCVLYAAGAGLGFWLSLGAAEALVSALPTLAEVGMPRLEIAPDLRVFAFSLAVALVAALATGALPALAASRPELVPALKSGAEGGLTGGRRGVGVGRLRRVFVSLQIALTLLLLVTSGLLVRSLQASGEAELAFRTAGVATVSLDLASEGYDEAAGLELGHRFLERAAALPGVAEAALVLDLPLDLSSHGTAVYLDGGGEGAEREMGVEFNVVSPGYFAALGLPLRAGRKLGPRDTPQAPRAAVVSRAFARAAWPEATAGEILGRRFRFGDSEAPWTTVVGLVDDVANQTFGEEVDPMVYLAWEQHYAPNVYLVVHAEGGDAAAGVVATRAAVDELRHLDPDLAVGPIRELRQITDLSRSPQRLATGVASGLGLVALLLASLGIYGVVAFAAARRRREVGIRMALGAERGQILRGVLRRELATLVPALVVGVGLALLAARGLRGLLYGVGPADPLALTAAVGLLLAAILTAALLPARRSAAIDPAEALRGS